MSGFLTHNDGLWLDESEGINDNLAFNGLNRIDDHSYSAGGKLLKRLLGVDIDGRKPAPESRMRVIPTDNGFRSIQTNDLSTLQFNRTEKSLPSSLPQHIHHLGLKNRIHGLDTDTCTTLRHRKHIRYPYCIFIHEFTQHQTHNFHRHTSPSMS